MTTRERACYFNLPPSHFAEGKVRQGGWLIARLALLKRIQDLPWSRETMTFESSDLGTYWRERRLGFGSLLFTCPVTVESHVMRITLNEPLSHPGPWAIAWKMGSTVDLGSQNESSCGCCIFEDLKTCGCMLGVLWAGLMKAFLMTCMKECLLWGSWSGLSSSLPAKVEALELAQKLAQISCWNFRYVKRLQLPWGLGVGGFEDHTSLAKICLISLLSVYLVLLWICV